jgi:hypothetical protein
MEGLWDIGDIGDIGNIEVHNTYSLIAALVTLNLYYVPVFP